ncbi:MAG: GlsB/YeaQ/YmgE family stress response membrane protein [Erysipelotrichaceae bacterium]|nr:GlsB/YeaQ/YmgE family stress response membrane protein [Erysipelotrichaceae bacterium]MBR3168686.1 GlsB/YeaQ/YmgE family stress response membrane protein [Erysipelotrichaceae bacterium]
MFGIIRMIIVGLLAGYVGNYLMSGKADLNINCLLVGIVGSVLGHFVFGLIGLAAYGIIGELIVAVCGTCLFLYLVKKFR